ncbi:MAG TPA: hypothetical protein VN625_01965 [Desulfuromonadaceae bacterium]|nr:hypothetical protein [Desulfuromonadaceae bacterium]
MKYLLPAIAAVFLAFRVSAQVIGVEVKLDQEQFLPGETLPITVRVFNNAGQTLHLGADANWLTFTIVSLDDNSAVIKTGDPDVIKTFDLGSTEVATKRLDIAPYYELKRRGRYRLTATVHIAEWGSDVNSAPKEFDIIDGAELWSRDFGVPSTATDRPPEVRKYVLEEANYLRKQLRMYVLVTDQSRRQVFNVKQVGPMVSFSQPEVQLDPKSNLHVLYQSGAQTFIYSVINPDGKIEQQDIYDLFDTRPHLGVDQDGTMKVIGGVRRVKPGELPTIVPPPQLAPTSPPPATVKDSKTKKK